MSKTFSVTVPDRVAKALSRWADSSGRTRGNLAGFLLEWAARSKYPSEFTNVPLPGEISPTDHQALVEFISKLATGDVNTSDVAIVSHIAQVDPDRLQNQLSKTNTNKNS